MKCDTRAAAIARYGHIDLARGVWPEEYKWLKLWDLPFAVPGFKVEGHQVVRINCNIDLHAPLTQVFSALKAKNLLGLLHTFDGCFNIRPVRGSTFVSTHAYGLGIDLNAAENPLGSTRGGFYDHPEFVQCWLDSGFDWGGHFHGRKDPMHFSRAWEHPAHQITQVMG